MSSLNDIVETSIHALTHSLLETGGDARTDIDSRVILE